MRLINLINLFYKDLRRQRKRASLTVLSLAWGTLTIVMLLSFGEGINTQFSKGSRGLGEGIVILSGGQTQIPYQGLPKGRRIMFKESDVELLKQRLPEIELIGGEYDRWANTVSHDETTVTAKVNGCYPSFDSMRSHFPQAKGRFINELDMQLKRRVAFLGNDMKEKLFGTSEAIGKIIHINTVPFTIIGVMIDKLQLSQYGGPDAERVVIPATTFQAMFGDRYLDRIIYKPKDPTFAKFIQKKVLAVLGNKYKFDPEDKQALRVWDVIESEEGFTKINMGLAIFMIIIGTLTLIVGGTGVANIMYVSVNRRRKEIGIKLALGARSIYILLQFLLEALIIVVIGGVIGILASLLIIGIVRNIPAEGMAWDYIGHPVFSMEIALITAIILGVIGLFAGYFPARRASLLNPIESLRYE
ncbi:MAG: hypothetical protein A2Y62_08440 [Candidatus Fischerbacteria bacterium RBG_13_37_8]|uniref:ABC transporter permease n=1 Tax=Candidatus Fischerbacteria bacterium RBG_13_37_8 TaxID=1817863 RepID=A0A1F5VT33_9BACT|nr:MAG: hypothetical protein A2Y62_08440 [Candidatus Fischerbacteria bacterium RBG_13_37_8]